MANDELNANVIAEIYKFLPGRNCGEKSPCGFPKCKEFAKALLKSAKDVDDCPYLEDDDKMQSIILIIEDYFH